MMNYMMMIDSPTDRSKFEKLYEEYRNAMYQAAYRVLQNTDDAEDAVHQAFVKIAEKIENIDGTICPRTKGYCITTAENKAIDLYRHKQKRSCVELDLDYMGLSIEYDGPNLITECISHLPAVQREVLMLKHLYGFTAKEIAEQLNLTEANVIKIDQRAKKRLRQICQEEGIDI